MLHSGSRGVGNRIGQYFIELAKEDMRRAGHQPARRKTSPTCPRAREHFDDYVEAVEWAQGYAMVNRQVMMDAMLCAALPIGAAAVRGSDARR